MSSTKLLKNTRETKYCIAIKKFLKSSGHATNVVILDHLRKDYPYLSATTVHRATQRLYSRGLITLAPPDINGSTRYDTNLNPHDHFMCQLCGCLRDVDLANEVLNILEDQIKDCRISGNITIYGTCHNCIKEYR